MLHPRYLAYWLYLKTFSLFLFSTIAYLLPYLEPIYYRIHVGHVRAFPLCACAVKPARSRDALYLIAAPCNLTAGCVIRSQYILRATQSSAILWTIRRTRNGIRGATASYKVGVTSFTISGEVGLLHWSSEIISRRETISVDASRWRCHEWRRDHNYNKTSNKT